MWTKDLTQFKREMQAKLKAQIKEKGPPGKLECENADAWYLVRKAGEHLAAGNYADAANYCFLLWQGFAK